MIASNRTRRAALRTMRRNGVPATASSHMIAIGIPAETAHQFSPAFSRGVTATGIATRVQARTDGTLREIPVKVYSRPTFLQRLAAYRPKDAVAAALFATALRNL